MRARVLTALAVAGMFVVPLAGAPAAHAATATAECPNGDFRTPQQQLPRPGVVLVNFDFTHGLQFSGATIDTKGALVPLPLDNWKPTYPIVAAWENATACSGDEDTRNDWAVAPDGKVYTGNGRGGPETKNFGDMAAKHLNLPIIGMSPTRTGNGYWLVALDGGIFAYGDAQFYGSTGNIHLNQPIVGMAMTPSGNGYYLVALDGGIFAYGDAQFYGSTGNIHLNQPIVAMTVTPSGHGYWMTALDGGIFAFGDATFHGSTGNQTLSAPILGMIPNGDGYTLIGADGKLYPFS